MTDSEACAYDPHEEDARQWADAYTMEVGTAYACAQCGTVILVSRSGVGNLEPICCGTPMSKVARREACQ